MLLFIVLMATDPNPRETLLIVEPKMSTEETESNDLALSMKRCYLHQFLKFNKFRNLPKVTEYNNGEVDDNLLSCDLTALHEQRLKFMEWYLGSIKDQFSFTEEFTEVSDKILQLITDFPKTANAGLISSDGKVVEIKTRDDFFAEAFDIYLTHMIVAEMDAALRLKLTNTVCKIIVEAKKTVRNDTVLDMRIEYEKIAEDLLTAYEKASKNMIFAYKKIAEDTSTAYKRLLGDVDAAHKETDKDMRAAYEKAIENIGAAHKTLVKRKKATNKIKGLKEVETCKKIVDNVNAAYRKVTEDVFAEHTKSAALVETWNKLLVNMCHDSTYSKNIKLYSAGKTIMTGLKCKSLVERASFVDFYTDLKIYYSKAANKSKKAVIQKPTVIIIDFTKALIQHLLQCNKETDEKEIALLRKAFIKNTLKFLTTNADGDYLRCFTPDIVEKMKIVAFPIAENDIRSMLIFAGIDKSHFENCFKESYVLTTILHKYANDLTWLIKSALRKKGRIMCKFALTDHKSSSEEEIDEEETGEEETVEEEIDEEETVEEEIDEEEIDEEEIDEEDNKPRFISCFENGEITPWILQKYTQTTDLISKDEEATDKRIGSKHVNPNNKSRPDNASSGIEYKTDARKKLICRNSDKSDKKLPTSKEKKAAETNSIEITKMITCSIANGKHSLELYYSIVISPNMIDSFIFREIKGISFFSLTAQSDPRVEMIYGLYAIADHTQDPEIEPRSQKTTYNPMKTSDDGHKTKNKVKKVRP